MSYYVKLYCYIEKHTKIKIRGIGFLSRKLIIKDRTLDIQGIKFYLNHNMIGAYSKLLGGEWNEPETNIFLKKMEK